MKSDRRRELFQRIQTLPGLSPEDRAALLGLLAETKRYGLVWEDKPEAAHEILRGKIPVFVEDAKRRIEASEEDAPHHVLIEGDNLHALAALQYTHAGKIDVIYIDPPYNTGNKDFRYNDDYVDKEDSFRHSKWLSFMEKRIRFSRTLLSECGVFLVSIDDNEFAQLSMLVRDVFRDQNEVARLPTIMNLKGNQDQFAFAGAHEYTIVACLDKESADFGQFPVDEDEIEEEWETDDVGYFKRGAPLNATGIDSPRSKRPNMFYPLLVKGGTVSAITVDEYSRIYCKELGLFDDEYIRVLESKYTELGYEFVLPKSAVSADAWGRWRWGYSKENVERLARDVIVVRTKSSVTLYKKQRPEIGDLPSSKPKTIWYKPEYSSGNGNAQLKSILGHSLETAGAIYPKPVQLIKDLISIGNKQRDLVVLDFFAGSGTTLHATMALNAEDGGKRQCILVTNNENGICEEVCYERNKRVIQGYRTPKGEDMPGLSANHLHYLKTEVVDREPTTKNRRQLVKLAVDLIRLKENAWDRIAGLSTGKEVQAFQGKDFTLFVVVDVDRIPAVVEQVRSLPGKSKVYVLSPDADPFTADFEEVQDRLDLVALPEAIYRSLLPVWRTLPEPGTEAEVADA